MLRKRSVIVAAGIGIFAGFVGGMTLTSVYARSDNTSLLSAFHPIRRTEKDLPLINPLVAYETPEATSFKEYQQLKSRIQRIIDGKRESGNVQNVSVYYRNLETGDWIGIGQNDAYYPASLLKVPVMIAYFKQAESNSALLDTEIRYQPITGGDPFEAQSALQAGKSYRVSDLIERMIVDSDNGATYTLIDNIDANTLNEVYSDLGITHPGEDTSTYQIPTKTYALFFRVLFNATYLSPEYSQKALALLARTTYRDGIAAGMPADMSIAHKFGEHVMSEDRKVAQGVELHDCGIVYYPGHPYLMCVMTRASTLPDAQGAIQDVSREVYETVKSDSAGR